jgi:hypothetical protein
MTIKLYREFKHCVVYTWICRCGRETTTTEEK